MARDWIRGRCAKCKKRRTKKGHDPCIANLPGVEYACCGHGNGEGYIFFNNGLCIRMNITSIDQSYPERFRNYDWISETEINWWGSIIVPDDLPIFEPWEHGRKKDMGESKRRKEHSQADPAALPTLAKGKKPPPGFVGYSYEGHFIHYCECGKEAGFGVGYFPRKGEMGKWYCREHRPFIRENRSASGRG